MWEKKHKLSLTELVIFAVHHLNLTGAYVSWKTSNNLFHLCSLETITEISDNDYNENTIFIIWEKGK